MDESTPSGFIWEVQNPTRPSFATCVVITPKRKGQAALDIKVQRNFRRKKALEFALELLKKCDVPKQLVEQVAALHAAAEDEADDA